MKSCKMVIQTPLFPTDAQESTFFKGGIQANDNHLLHAVKHFCFFNDLQVNMCVRLMDSGRAPKEKNHSQSVSLVMDTFIQEIRN